MLLKEWIEQKDVKKGEVAKVISVSNGRLTRILAGIEKPTLMQAAAIVKLTKGKVKLNDLIEGYKHG